MHSGASQLNYYGLSSLSSSDVKRGENLTAEARVLRPKPRPGIEVKAKAKANLLRSRPKPRRKINYKYLLHVSLCDVQ